MSNTGIPINNGLIFDAVLYKGVNSRVISGSDYLDNNAVMSNSPGMELMDTQNIGTGVLVGDMVMTIMWDSSGTTDYDILVQIVKDGGYDHDIMFKHESTSHDFGTSILHKFDPKSNYRIIISSLSTSEVILDYIKFTPVFPGSMVSATRRVKDGEELIEVVDRGSDSVVGNNNVAQSTIIYFNTVFDTIPTLSITSTHWKLHPNIDWITNQNAQIALTNIDNDRWSGTANFDWIAIGGKKVPFAPGLEI